MNKNFRKFILVLSSFAMIALCVFLGEGGMSQVNKNEVMSADAAGVDSVSEVVSTETPSVELYNQSGDAFTGTDTDALDTDALDKDALENQSEEKATEAATEATVELSEAEKLVSKMSVEDKVAQLFVITPDALTSTDAAMMAGEATKTAINETPVGGLIYMGDNLQAPQQVKDMLSKTNEYSVDRIGLPMFLCVDEEGGTVARVAGSNRFGVTNVGNMSEIGANGTVEDAKAAGETMGTYLSDLGFNIDFAPVADVLTNPENSIVKYRSFGCDMNVVSDMSIAVAKGLESKGITPTYKHFPGHGATAGDTHLGAAFTTKTIDDLKKDELVPFQTAIDSGAKIIMVSHISAPNITGHDTPASLSDVMITELLREDMGYDGIVITDSMEMGAISSKYTSDEAAVLAIQAGADMILMPEDFQKAYEGVLEAVKKGEISEERLNESVARIVEVKLAMDK